MMIEDIPTLTLFFITFFISQCTETFHLQNSHFLPILLIDREMLWWEDFEWSWKLLVETIQMFFL